jgi:hypothetical protein
LPGGLTRLRMCPLLLSTNVIGPDRVGRGGRPESGTCTAPARGTGWRRSCPCRCSPGATQFTMMPFRAVSSARLFSQAGQAGLRRCIIHLAEGTGLPDDRADLDDPAEAPVEHVPQYGLDHVKGAGEVHAQHQQPYRPPTGGRHPPRHHTSRPSSREPRPARSAGAGDAAVPSASGSAITSSTGYGPSPSSTTRPAPAASSSPNPTATTDLRRPHKKPTSAGSSDVPHKNPTDEMTLSGIRRHGC